MKNPSKIIGGSTRLGFTQGQQNGNGLGGPGLRLGRSDMASGNSQTANVVAMSPIMYMGLTSFRSASDIRLLAHAPNIVEL